MPRYVLLRHECPADYGDGPHWDFMLEHEGSLLTWSLLELPSANNKRIDATKLADHRIAYLDYEGPVGGNRGSVEQVTSGEFEWIQNGPALIEINVASGSLAGSISLTCREPPEWTLTHCN